MANVLTELIKNEMPRIEGRLAAAKAAAERDARLGFGPNAAFDSGGYLKNEINNFAIANGLAGLDYFPHGEKEGTSDVLIPPYAVLRFNERLVLMSKENILAADDVITALGGNLQHSPRIKGLEGNPAEIFFTAIPVKKYEEVRVAQPRRLLGIVPLGHRVASKTSVKELWAPLTASYLNSGGGISGGLRVELSYLLDANYERAASALASLLFGFYSFLREATPARNSA